MRLLRRRLDRLTSLCPLPAVPHLYLAFVDEQGRIPEDGSEAARRWVGRRFVELPNPVPVVMGVDPLRVPGRPGGRGHRPLAE